MAWQFITSIGKILVATFNKLKIVYVKLFKNSGIALAIVIPLVIILSQFNLLPNIYIEIITLAVVLFAVSEAMFNAILKKYESTKARLTKLNRDIKKEDSNLDYYINSDQSLKELTQLELEGLGEKILLLINKIKSESKKEKITEPIKENSQIDETRISVR